MYNKHVVLTHTHMNLTLTTFPISLNSKKVPYLIHLHDEDKKNKRSLLSTVPGKDSV